jgi:hypothetical protein
MNDDSYCIVIDLGMLSIRTSKPIGRWIFLDGRSICRISKSGEKKEREKLSERYRRNINDGQRQIWGRKFK